jgi:hypothetical protein
MNLNRFPENKQQKAGITEMPVILFEVFLFYSPKYST